MLVPNAGRLSLGNWSRFGFGRYLQGFSSSCGCHNFTWLARYLGSLVRRYLARWLGTVSTSMDRDNDTALFSAPRIIEDVYGNRRGYRS